MDREAEIRRRIKIKQQLIELTKEEIETLKKELDLIKLRKAIRENEGLVL